MFFCGKNFSLTDYVPLSVLHISTLVDLELMEKKWSWAVQKFSLVFNRAFLWNFTEDIRLNSIMLTYPVMS